MISTFFHICWQLGHLRNTWNQLIVLYFKYETQPPLVSLKILYSCDERTGIKKCLMWQCWCKWLHEPDRLHRFLPLVPQKCVPPSPPWPLLGLPCLSFPTSCLCCRITLALHRIDVGGGGERLSSFALLSVYSSVTRGDSLPGLTWHLPPTSRCIPSLPYQGEAKRLTLFYGCSDFPCGHGVRLSIFKKFFYICMWLLWLVETHGSVINQA